MNGNVPELPDVYQFALPVMNSNMFLILSGQQALILDPNCSAEAEAVLEQFGIQDLLILLTHEHFDHISGVNRFREWAQAQPGRNCRVIASRRCGEMIGDPRENLAEFFMAMMIAKSEEERKLAETIFRTDYRCSADETFEGRTELRFADMRLALFETPGHSPGSICVEIYRQDALWAVVTGDSLVEGNKVITRLPGGDKKAYKELTRPYLEALPPETMILPGHGEVRRLKKLELG